MKKHLSVLALFARGTIYWVLGLLLVMAAAECALFYPVLGRALAAGAAAGPEQLLSQSRVPLICAVCFALLVALLCATGCERGGRQGYTLRRLSVSERSVFLWQAGYNTLCLFLFWSAQLFIALALCRLYAAKASPELISGQTVFLGFYRSGFLHGLLPLSEISRWVRNFALALGLGAASASYPYLQRRGRSGFGAPVVLAALTLGFFVKPLGSTAGDLAITGVSILCGYIAVSGVLRGEDENEA